MLSSIECFGRRCGVRIHVHAADDVTARVRTCKTLGLGGRVEVGGRDILRFRGFTNGYGLVLNHRALDRIL